MNRFFELLERPATDQQRLGYLHTAREIRQQPALWSKVADQIISAGADLARFLDGINLAPNGEARVVLTGAGSSEFVGRAVAPLLRGRVSNDVIVYPTTDMVTHPAAAFVDGRSHLVVSFNRSGDSPESLASYRRIRMIDRDARFLVVTCNPNGAVSRAAHRDPHALSIVLPEESLDLSLAMTSSFTAMAVATIGLAYLTNPDDYRALVRQMSTAAERLLDLHASTLFEIAEAGFNRACFLGSPPVGGMLAEAALKMQELSAGRVVSQFNSFLGVRHGPQVFIDESCTVFATLSADESVQRYERDLLAELRAKGQGRAIVGMAPRPTPELQGLCDHLLDLAPTDTAEQVNDEVTMLPILVAYQLVAMATSLRLGLRPDNPAESGIINRVVQGVTIYDP